MSPACSARQLEPVAALRDREMAELLGRAARRVEHLRAVLDVPERMRKNETSPDVRLGQRLEHLRRERRAVLGMDLDFVLALGAVEGVQLFHLVRRRHQLDELASARSRAVGRARAQQQKSGKDLAALHAFLHRRDFFVARDLAAVEVALEQRVVGRRDRLEQLAVVAVEALAILGRDVRLSYAPPARAVELCTPR